MARWVENFEQLFKVNPPSGQLHIIRLQMVDADPPINKAVPVAKLRGGKAADICNISAEMLKAGGEAMIRGLHTVLTAVWHSGTIPSD